MEPDSNATLYRLVVVARRLAVPKVDTQAATLENVAREIAEALRASTGCAGAYADAHASTGVVTACATYERRPDTKAPALLVRALTCGHEGEWQVDEINPRP